jgi:DNA-binding transcriptional regulator GbsR (MarR family)
MDEEQHRFIEDMGQDMAGWGLSRTAGRVYAWLLLQSEPTSLDEIVAGLGIAKSGASVAARGLVAMGLARSTGQRGSRRLRYEALREPDALMAARSASVVQFLNRLEQGVCAAPEGPAQVRLRELTGMLRSLEEEIQQALQRLARERRRA